MASFTNDDLLQKFAGIEAEIADSDQEHNRHRVALDAHRNQIASLSRSSGSHAEDIATLELKIEELRRLITNEVAKVRSEIEPAVLVADNVHELEVALLGDREQLEIHETARRGNVTPNIPRPPPGVLDVMRASIDVVSKQVQALSESVDRRVEIATKLANFFGPMLADKNPPLDGETVASKGYVDEAVARFARAIRDEVSEARALTGELLSIMRHEASEPADRRKKLASWLGEVISRERVTQQTERARRGRPSRMQSLIHAITGQDPKNGSQP